MWCEASIFLLILRDWKFLFPGKKCSTICLCKMSTTPGPLIPKFVAVEQSGITSISKPEGTFALCLVFFALSWFPFSGLLLIFDYLLYDVTGLKFSVVSYNILAQVWRMFNGASSFVSPLCCNVFVNWTGLTIFL